jgi:hypothetical protein
MDKYDFSGYATRNDLKCADGRVIRRDAFKGNDGRIVPLVWNHQHNDASNVLGHALLENRDDGVYAYASFNDSESGNDARELVHHGDVTSLSIYANNLQERGKDVIHGIIREVSLVLAGANPGAFIDTVMMHGDEETDGLIVGYDEAIELNHSESGEKEDEVTVEGDTLEHSGTTKETDIKEKPKEDIKDNSKEDTTIQDVIDTMSEDQKNAMYALVGLAVEDATKNNKDEEDGGEDDMKHNLFENETKDDEGAVLSHEQIGEIIGDAKRYGSLKDSFFAHADTYGINNIDYLFPDARAIDSAPGFITRQMDWVQKVIDGTKHTPFSRIKSIFADITEDAARAKGYLKGNLKKDEVFALLKRTTTPTTIYKKQKMDRDDIVDITDFDVVAWLKTEMRMMLNEEIARSILVGDGRLADSEDKINETNIRPIWKDDALYAVKATVEIAATDSSDQKAHKFITAAIKNRKLYKGSGNPTLFTTEDVVTDCLLMEDTTGRRIYNTVSDLAIALRVSEIVTVEPMENLTRTGSDTKVYTLLGIMVNLLDYNVGADKGGAINMFDDFDIDYNQQKYLIETRCSGALVKPYSALVFESTPVVAG